MNILLIGPQSSGKGTQADLLSKKLNIPHITTGEILRKEKESGSEEGKSIASYIDRGELVPDELIDKIVQERLEELKSGTVLDGYPRNQAQAEALEKYFILDKAIFLDVPDAVVLKRISLRRVCLDCGTIYNLQSNPPQHENKCDKCDKELTQRHDDTGPIIAVRLNTYHEQTEPLIKYYEERGKLICIDGTKIIEEVHEDIKKELGIRN